MQTDDRYGSEYPEWDDAVEFLLAVVLAVLAAVVVLGVWG